jgi:ER degradation enhancer, mannosidase alpha-like 1
MFNKAYSAILKHVKTDSGLIYKNINMETGDLAAVWIDSLGAFFPGLQVIFGDVNNAIRHHFLYYTIWERYSSLPERFSFTEQDISS